MRLFSIVALSLLTIALRAAAQDCSVLDLRLAGEIPSTCAEPTMTMIEDTRGLPYLYVAQKEGGLKIASVSDITSPDVVMSIPIAQFGGLHVMSLTQAGSFLYLALGNSFGTTTSQSPGLAIVDVTDPTQPRIRSVYTYPIANSGAGIVAVSGGTAYLGAMGHGVVVLDVSKPDTIQYLSEFLPDRNFPVPNQDTLKVNARGMAVRNGYLYLADDAGGFRVIDTHDPLHLTEVGRYVNHLLDHLPRAYNNVVLTDTIAFVTTDYCGIEALSIADPANPRQVCWWNPWNCTSNPLNWFSSPGHTNEIVYNATLKKLFVATGKSDMYVVDASDPRHLDSCSSYGGVDNGIGTWGIAAGGSDRIYLSYICTAGIPFASNWSGVKILNYNGGSSSISDVPHPAQGSQRAFAVTGRSFAMPIEAARSVRVTDATGRSMLCAWQFTSGVLTVLLPQTPGLYSIAISGEKGTATFTCLKLP